MLFDNFSHLAAFAAVARHSSFRKAAAELAMSTSAISYAVRGLEERLGVALFNRTTRSVALTDAGQRLLERLQPALRDVSDALDEMNSFRSTPTGTLRINTSRIGAALVLAPLMGDFLQAYPQINLEIVDDDGFIDIVAGGFDAGIRFEDSVPEDMVAVAVGAPPRCVFVASPHYLQKHPAPLHPNDLFQHDCLRHRLPSGRVVKWEFEKEGVQLELDVKGRLTLGDTDLKIRAVLDGVCIAFLLESQVADWLAAGRLVRVLDDWSPIFPGLSLYYPRQRRISSALRAFIDTARARVQS